MKGLIRSNNNAESTSKKNSVLDPVFKVTLQYDNSSLHETLYFPMREISMFGHS